MNCDTAQPFLEAYVDDELDAANTLKVEDHLRSCDSCSRFQKQLEALRSVIAAHGPRYSAPEDLRRRIQADLRGTTQSTTHLEKHGFDWKWLAIAASLVISAVALWRIPPHPRPDPERPIANEMVASHVRSLMANHLVDEPSSDQHTVKPWFAGKLDFSPAVKDLGAKGFVVAGGRLDYLADRPVAAIVYRRRQHVINLFVWPSAQSNSVPRNPVAVNGFNTVEWISEGLRYGAVSDLNKPELELFSRLWLQE